MYMSFVREIRRLVSGSLDVWMSGSLDLWMSGCLDVWMSGCLHFSPPPLAIKYCSTQWLILEMALAHGKITQMIDASPFTALIHAQAHPCPHVLLPMKKICCVNASLLKMRLEEGLELTNRWTQDLAEHSWNVRNLPFIRLGNYMAKGGERLTTRSKLPPALVASPAHVLHGHPRGRPAT